MKISLNWIKDFVDLDGIETDELIKRFNLTTAEIEKVKAAIATDNTEEIKAATEALQKVFYEISAKMYQQAQGQEGAQPGTNEANGEVVDED